jgi:hypothetical protein
MITGVRPKRGILLDQRTGLVAVKARHHDVAEDDVRMVVGNLRQRIETVFRQHDLAAGLHQKYFGAASDGVAVVDHHHLDAVQIDCFRHAPLCLLVLAAAYCFGYMTWQPSCTTIT